MTRLSANSDLYVTRAVATSSSGKRIQGRPEQCHLSVNLDGLGGADSTTVYIKYWPEVTPATRIISALDARRPARSASPLPDSIVTSPM